MLSRFIRKPWLHFLLLGCVLFYFDRQYNTVEEVLTVEWPEAEQIAELKSQWLRTTGRPASAQDLDRLIQYELDQSILLAEAVRYDLHRYDTVVQQRLLRDMRFMGDSEGMSDVDMLEQAYALNLHINDTVAKRRLVQAMESLLRAEGEAREPEPADLETIYQQRMEEFTLPESRQISHVFVSADKHRAETEERAQSLFKSFSVDEVPWEQAKMSGDPFLSGLQFSQLSERQLARHFGDRFASSVFTCTEPGWCGPFESPYGWHLVWLHGLKAAEPQTIEAVDSKLRYYYQRQQGDLTMEDAMVRLRARYEVVGKPSAEEAGQ